MDIKVRDDVIFKANDKFKGFIYEINDKYIIVNCMGNEFTYTHANFFLQWKIVNR